MTMCHQPSTTGGTKRRAGIRAGCMPGQQHCKMSSMGTSTWVTRPLPSKVSKPKPPCNMQRIGSRFAPAGPILQGFSRSSPEDHSLALALPAPSPRVLAIPLQQHPGTLLPLPAHGRLIGVGIFAPGPVLGLFSALTFVPSRQSMSHLFARAGGVPAWHERGSQHLSFQPDLDTRAGR